MGMQPQKTNKIQIAALWAKLMLISLLFSLPAWSSVKPLGLYKMSHRSSNLKTRALC